MDFETAVIARAVPAIEFGLGIKKIHLARPAVLEQANDGLGAGRMVRSARREQIARCCRLLASSFRGEKMRQRQRSQAARVAAQEGPTCGKKLRYRHLSS